MDEAKASASSAHESKEDGMEYDEDMEDDDEDDDESDASEDEEMAEPDSQEAAKRQAPGSQGEQIVREALMSQVWTRVWIFTATFLAKSSH